MESILEISLHVDNQYKWEFWIYTCILHVAALLESHVLWLNSVQINPTRPSVILLMAQEHKDLCIFSENSRERGVKTMQKEYEKCLFNKIREYFPANTQNALVTTNPSSAPPSLRSASAIVACATLGEVLIREWLWASDVTDIMDHN